MRQKKTVGRIKRLGQSLAETALLISLIAIVCIAAMTLLGNRVGQSMGNLACQYISSIAAAQQSGATPADCTGFAWTWGG